MPRVMKIDSADKATDGYKCIQAVRYRDTITGFAGTREGERKTPRFKASSSSRDPDQRSWKERGVVADGDPTLKTKLKKLP